MIKIALYIFGALGGIILLNILFISIKNFFKENQINKEIKEIIELNKQILRNKDEINKQEGRVSNVKEDFYNKLNEYNDLNNKQR